MQGRRAPHRGLRHLRLVPRRRRALRRRPAGRRIPHAVRATVCAGAAVRAPRSTWRLAVIVAGALMITATVLLGTALPAAAAPDDTAQLSHVIDNVRNWIVGMLVTLATLFLTVAGLRYLMAGGNPGEIERAKGTLKSAAIGYALAVLAPVLVGILRSVVGT